jgi:hypothetical protein
MGRNTPQLSRRRNPFAAAAEGFGLSSTLNEWLRSWAPDSSLTALPRCPVGGASTPWTIFVLVHSFLELFFRGHNEPPPLTSRKAPPLHLNFQNVNRIASRTTLAAHCQIGL